MKYCVTKKIYKDGTGLIEKKIISVIDTYVPIKKEDKLNYIKFEKVFSFYPEALEWREEK